MTLDITATTPYFCFKRGRLTLLLEARAKDKVSAVKQMLVNALLAQGNDDAFADISVDTIRLYVQQQQQFRQLENSSKVSECQIADGETIYFVLQRDNGTWEAPHAADYDADAQDMEIF
ncbi:hypothetical protein IWW36_002752 [Coemansia brasiliensis]|uniref:Ubiquitin-like domain-containing protein n=1 Tax=Coemansia brasiliensis TaxID=2650707 RepID=A0A9W8I6I8_9FUNG|nr:hypothetical protein IWW36_002752 [Coemansia brasiliensis]